MPDSSARACSTDTPAASRPTTEKLRLSRRSARDDSGSMAAGIHRSALFGKRTSSGMTPMIVAGSVFTLITRPITAASPP